MKPHCLAILFTTCLFTLTLPAEQAPPEKALKYHEALLKRPQNSTLLDRFFSAWIDEQPIETLDAFLAERAKQNGGQDLAILAQHQLRRGLEDEALVTLGSAIEALPDESYLLMERAKIQLRRLDFKPARTDLKKAAQSKDPQLALEATKLIGKSWLREGNSKNAIETWDKLLAANPKDEDLLEDLVESAAAEGETEQAITYVKKLIEASSDPYKKTLRQLRHGDLLAQAGLIDDAIKTYSETLAQCGEGSWLEREILAQIDATYRKQDRIDDLKTKFTELATANPRRLLIHRQLAKIEASQGDVDSAIGRFREVLKRSPGNQELREEFIRLLTDSEKFDLATEELDKLIAASPDNAGLFLQLADLQNRQEDKPATKAALEKALTIFGDDETAGIRIASLMFQYGLNERGEELLKKLVASENASLAPSEALASQYARSNRKPEAIAIYQKIGTDNNLDVILRAAGSISALGESKTAFELLSKKAEEFSQEPRFLASIAQAALSSESLEDAVKYSTRLVRISKSTSDIAQSIELAMRSITSADKSLQWLETLSKQPSRTPSETCLLAALAESHGDFDTVENVLSGNNEPIIIRFHTVILERRGQWNEAIATLSLLKDTDEGRKASFFKDLAELQRNAGLPDDALKTIERWKQSAPTDKTAYVVGSSILRENARSEEAVQMIRQAVSRFKEDTDLAANLAQLHEEVGEMHEAQTIYWELYDNSESPADQARWATNLAQVALRTGRTQELEEQLRERARSNRGSIGPVLAQAELARITNNEDKRRDLLLEAVRLQPKNIDLRLQIANLEEQSGNPDRVVAILEEAVDTDSTGRIRNALAQAYLRQGQILKGMRELQRFSGKQSTDPRFIETSAATLASSGLYDEAIRYLREALPDGGDWRSKYLLAIMLEQDGRESEAIPLFQSLLQASDEIPSLKPQTNHNQQQYWDNFPESVRAITRIMMAGRIAYAHRDQDNRYSYNSGGNQEFSSVGSFTLPNTTEHVRNLASIHLAKIHPQSMEEAGFISALINSENPHQPDFAALLKQFPQQPGLFELTLLYGSWNQESKVDTELLKELLTKNQNLSPLSRFQAYLLILKDAEPNDPSWQEIAKISKTIAESEDNTISLQLGYHLLNLLENQNENENENESLNPPDDVRKTLTQILLKIADKEQTQIGPFGNFKLIVINSVGTQEEWIKTANESVTSFREQKPQSANSRASRLYSPYQQHYSMGNSSPFILPTIEALSIRTLPPEVLHMIQPEGNSNRYYGIKSPSAKDLLPKIDTFESPTLRTWVALRAGDEDAIKKALSAEPPSIEAADFKTLQAFHAISQKDYLTAYKLFTELRPSYSSDRNLITWLNYTLVAIANEMKPEETSKLTEELRALLIQCRTSLGIQGAPILAEQAKKFGMTDLAERFLPRTPTMSVSKAQLGRATFSRNNSSSSASGNASIDKMVKFSTEGKTKAAAIEALNLIRKANQSRYNRSYEIQQIKEKITPEVIAELLKDIDPGDSKSLTKHIEYADITAEFGKPELALATLKRLREERPNDLQISGKLAFLLPADQQELAIELLSTAASGDEFVNVAITTAQSLENKEDPADAFRFFSTVTQWLEKADPTELQSANLTWVGFFAHGFFDGEFTDDLPAIDQPKPEKITNRKLYSQYLSIAKNLATAMLRHPSIAEEGFRLLGASKAWEIPVEEMDQHARNLFLNVKIETDNSYRNHYNQTYFILRHSTHSSSSNGDHAEHASVKWIADRLSAEKNSDEILPAEYLKNLTEKNPTVGELIGSLAELSTIKKLEALWKSDLLSKNPSPFVNMCRQAVLSRASNIPGSNQFFLERIKEIETKSLNRFGYNPNSPEMATFSAAIHSAANQKDTKTLSDICSTIAQKIFGDKIDLSAENRESAMKTYQGINVMERIIDGAKLEPAAAIRLHRELYKLGIPSANNEYQITQIFRSQPINNVKDAETLFASFGWLDDIDTWEPFIAIVVEAQFNGNQQNFIRKELHILPLAINYLQIKTSRSEISKHLQNLKPQTFGNLITAAFLHRGTEERKLIDQAFTLAIPKLAEITPERATAFAPLLSSLPDKTIAKLPAAFQKSLGNANAERLKTLTQTADEFLNNSALNNNRSYGSAFDDIEETIKQIAPLDLDKAIALFLEAERRYTESLTRGGRFSSYTSNDIQVSERDEALYSLLADSDSPLYQNPKIGLSFLKNISESKAATRFTFSPNSSYNMVPIFALGNNIDQTAKANRDRKKPSQFWLEAIRLAATYPEDIRKEALLATTIFQLGSSNYNDVKLERDRKELEKTKDLPEELSNLRTLCIGIRAWDSDSPQGKQTTKKALFSLTRDTELSSPMRYQLIATIASSYPQTLADSEIATEFTEQFENYAQGERTCINQLVMKIALSISKTNLPDSSQPFIKRINAALWDNANSSKSGGHSVIPASASEHLFLLSASAGDQASAKNLLNMARASLQGKIGTLATLISQGNHELAKELKVTDKTLYIRDSNRKSPPYDRHFEKQLEAFRKTPGLSPLDLLLFESQLKGDGPMITGDNAPLETETEREIRLAKAYKANPPTLLYQRSNTLAGLTRDSHTLAILLRDEIIALRDELNLEKTLDDWQKAESKYLPSVSTSYIAGGQGVIFRQAAFLEFLEGDLSGLNEIVDTLSKRPTGTKYYRGGDRYYVRDLVNRTLQSAPLWICEAVHLGKTEGFKNGFDVFRKFFLLTQERNELYTTHMYQSLAVAEYLAYWSGEGEKFKQMKSDVKREKKRLNYFNQPMGIFRIAYNARGHILWQNESFADARMDFLIQSFTRKEMEGLYSHHQNWLPDSGNRYGLRDDLLKIAANPPEGILPTVLPHLLNYLANHEFKQNNLDAGVTQTLAAIEACPTNGPWKNLRFGWQVALTERLFKANQVDRAKEIYASIDAKDLNKSQVKRLGEINKKIEAAKN